MSNTSDLEMLQQIETIADRAMEPLAKHGYTKDEICIALLVVHRRCCKLRLAEMADGRIFDLIHDVVGIFNNYDPATNAWRHPFLPRYAAAQEH